MYVLFSISLCNVQFSGKLITVLETYQTQRTCLTTFSNTEKRVENTTRSGVFLTNFEVFRNVVKYCLECFTSSRSKIKLWRKQINKNETIYANSMRSGIQTPSRSSVSFKQTTTTTATRTSPNRRFMSKIMSVHVHYNSLHISLPSSAKQEREMTQFCVLRAIGVLNRSRQSRL